VRQGLAELDRGERILRKSSVSFPHGFIRRRGLGHAADGPLDRGKCPDGKISRKESDVLKGSRE
jgi:hypothetical protein